MKEFGYTPPIIEAPAPENSPVIEASPEPIQEPSAATSPGKLIGAAADYMASDLENTVLKGMILGLDIAAALQGKKRRKQIRWNPTDEDVEQVAPTLAHHQREAKAQLREEIVVWERQKALHK